MSESDSETLYLVDGSSYLFRAYHALPPLSTTRGEPTGALFGVANMLRRFINEYRPARAAVVFDARGKTFRDELFEAYKANRPPMPEDLAEQIEPLVELVQALGFKVLRVPGVEADDVIGTLAKQALAEGLRTVVSTGDKDMAQLVAEGVELVNTMTDTSLDSQGVVNKFGVPPERMVDYLALVGDTSDNIPGIPGVGPKTAAKWLSAYGSLEGIVEHAGEIKGKIGERLREHLKDLELSRELATIRTDVELDVTPSDIRLGDPDYEALKPLLQRFELKSWLRELGVSAESDAPQEPAADYRTLLDWTDLDAWVERLSAADAFAFDTETTSLSAIDAELVGLSFALEPGEAAYVPVAHTYPGAPQQLDRDRVLARLTPLLEDPARAKIGQNLKYDRNVLAGYGVALNGIRYDTMLESYVLNSTASGHDMGSLARKYLDYDPIAYESVAGKGAKQISFAEVALEQAGPYAAEDADIALRLHRRLWPRLEADDALRGVYEELELPLIEVLARMEWHGVLVDVERLRHQSAELAKRMAALEDRAYELAGRRFNLGSPKQLQEILFDEHGLPVVRKTPKGQPSTAEDVLAELAPDFPLAQCILDYRQLSKLRSTYTERLPEQVNPRTGRVHTSYHQAVTTTGRLSSSEPNLQNIPIRSEEGRRIRQAFVAPAGHRVLAADYSQIELRLMAHLTGDPGLLHAFHEDIDVHRATASEVFGRPIGEVSDEQRRAAKTINFGLMYGMSAYGLARRLGIETEHANAYIERYFQRYPAVREYMEATRAQARRDGYVETLFGRRIHLPEIGSRNRQRREGAERAAINAPLQGSAADIIKRAMIAVDAWLRTEERPARMVMQVHDELVLEVQSDALDAVRDGIARRMSAAASLAVPLEVEVGIGENWDEAH